MPNVGYETIGTVGTRPLNGALRGLRITMPQAAQAGVTITAYIADSAPGNTFRAAIIDATDEETVLASSDIRTDISTAGWYTFSGGSLATFTPANGQTVIFIVGSNSAPDSTIAFDNSGASVHDGWAGEVQVFDPLDLLGPGAVDAGRDYSAYLTFTAAGRRFFLN